MKQFLFFAFFLFSLSLHAQTDFSQENATALLKVLSVDIGPRPMGSPAEQRALQFAVEKFREYGCDTAYLMRFERTSTINTNSGVAVGIKRGATNRLICIGGHIDSSSPEVAGADDDGSGSAVVMELARVFGTKKIQSTLVFCCFGGEEQGLIGSKYFVNHFEDIDSVVLMLQVDMANGLGIIDIDPDSYRASAPRWLVSAAVEEFYNLGYSGLRYPTHFFSLNYSFPSGAGSDHEPFLQKGIPAIDFSTDVGKPIHTTRDIFENFDPRGLKRSGDVVLKLIERFDGGTPSRETEQYWLYLAGKIPLMFELWVLWMFIVVSVVVGIITLLVVRRRHAQVSEQQRIRWSGIKTALFTVIIVFIAWFSPELMSLLKGVRNPWFVDIKLYYIYYGFVALIGIWLCTKLASLLPLAEESYPFMLRASIVLSIYLILLAFVSPKAALHPAMALFLLCLAMMIRFAPVRIVFLLLGWIALLRFIFSEWDELIFRTVVTSTSAPSVSQWLMRNSIIALFLSLYVLPLVYGTLAVIKDSPSLKILSSYFSTKGGLLLSLVLFGGMTLYLLPRPSYNTFWHRTIEVEQNINQDKRTTTITLQSPEYLSGLRIRHADVETTITSFTTSALITPRYEIDTLLQNNDDSVMGTSSWVKIFRTSSVEQRGDTTLFDNHLQLQMPIRPFTVSVSYRGKDSSFLDFDTPLQYRSTKSTRKIEWYSFPDSVLDIPVTFNIVGNDSVKEEITVTFNKLAYPMEFERELTSIIPRTVSVSEYMYKR